MTKTEALKYIRDNDFDIQNANASLLAAELVFQSYVNSRILRGIKFKPILSHFSLKRENFFYFYQIINTSTLRAIGAKIYRDYLENPESLKKIMRAHKYLEKKLDDIWLKYKKQGDIKKFFRILINTSNKWWQYASIGEDKGEVINNEIVPRFARRHKIDLIRAREILGILAHPEKPTVLNAERRSFLNICLSLTDNAKGLNGQIKNYLKNYFWADTDFYSAKEITKKSILEKAREEIKKTGKRGIARELSEIKANFNKLHLQKEKIKKKIRISSEDKKDIFFAKSIVEWQDERKFGMMKDCYYLFSFMKDISAQYGAKYADFSCYTIAEMFALLEGGVRLGAIELRKRQRDIFLVNERGEDIQSFYGKDAEQLLGEVLKKNYSKEIKGAVASGGNKQKISGIVNIILDPAREEFNEGAVLVTSMTRVEFVPLMRKAKAVITNEGGVACHAAIVSRELGIPCIIGTKIATKMLTDGDEVEMDLTTGVVKISGRKKYKAKWI